MGVVYYDVPLVAQNRSPICWVCCMAMVAAEREGHSPTIEKYLKGFNPAVSSISNPVGGDFNKIQGELAKFKFSSTTINPSVSSISKFLENNGPFILTHRCYGFYYGSGRQIVTNPDKYHAVVVTSADNSETVCTINNPWGDKDRFIPISNVINSLIEFQSIGPNVAYYTG